MFKYNLGDEVKSYITGFKGVLTSRAEHINGCNRYWVQPPADKGKYVEGCWMDEPELELVKAGKAKPVVKTPTYSIAKPGGFPSSIK